MDEKEKAEIGAQAAAIANQELIKELNKKKIGLPQVAARLKQSMNAKTQKVFMSDGAILYSKKLQDNRIRLDATKYVAQILGAEPAQRKEISGPGGGPIMTNDQGVMDRVDKFFADLKQKKPEV